MVTVMKRRHFLSTGMSAALAAPLLSAVRDNRLDSAADVLSAAVAGGQVESAVLHVSRSGAAETRHFGQARSADAMFLLGSISKPVCVTALMTLYDRGEFQLMTPLKTFLPEFTGDGREQVTLQHLLTHVSGLPDQLPENNRLRQQHAGLAEFVRHAMRTPLQFAPGTRYQYSSMGILLATHVAERMTGTSILEFTDQAVLKPLKMQHAALGLGRFRLEDMIRCQTEHAAPESGAGDPGARDWDWNSAYWRGLGAPWGGLHASAPDVARFLAELMLEQGQAVRPATARLMVTNHNGPGQTPRGLGFAVGVQSGSPGCSAKTFGHTGSTGTLAWADPESELVCVVLTSLPGRAVTPHPRELAAARVVTAFR